MSEGVPIRVVLPQHLQVLAGAPREVVVEVRGRVTMAAVLDGLEGKYPMLAGTIREHGTLKRRALVRFFACQEDWSHEPADALLPAAVAEGREAFFIVGAIAGGGGW